jgi:hypothetical protein
MLQSDIIAWSTYIFTSWSKRELVQQHASILHIFNIFRRGVTSISVQYAAEAV